MQNKETKGHLLACFTILIWGTTFISTKVLLDYMTPITILFLRFFIGFIMLFLWKPQILKNDRKHEKYFIGAGFCGVTLYFLLENIALTYTLVSNVGVIISVAPFFTAIFARFFLPDETLRKNFFIGFCFAIVGISIISFQGVSLQVSPIGDVLAIIAAIVWAMYSILTRKLSEFNYPIVPMTTKIFFYGLLFMVPAMFFFDINIDQSLFVNPLVIGNILYLGVGASALCFVTWNRAVKLLGAIKTSVYIYLVPVITVTTSVIILHEEITMVAMIGIIMTLLGLCISEYKQDRK